MNGFLIRVLLVLVATHLSSFFCPLKPQMSRAPRSCTKTAVKDVKHAAFGLFSFSAFHTFMIIIVMKSTHS